MEEQINLYDIKPIILNKEPRPIQKQLLKFTQDCIKNNKKNICIQAPTGTGKSFFCVMFMDWFKKNYDASAQFDILTNSKILQEQYTNEFDFMNSLWGKGSYQCETHSCDCGTGQEWGKLQNNKCPDCPYAIAKHRFENGDVALTNYHLFLTYMMYMPMAWKRSSRVLIIDEADSFEIVVSDFLTTKISKHLLKRNGLLDNEINNALNCFGQYPEDLDISEFVNIVADDFIPIIKTVINRLSRDAENGNMQSLNYMQSLSNNLLKWNLLKTEYDNLPSNWVLENEIIKKYSKDKILIDQYIEFTAQPVWCYQYLDQKIWSNYDYIIFMSGTILDKNEFCNMNGLEIDNSDYISIDSPFPIENRPIFYFHKTGKMSYATKDITWLKQKELLTKIFKKHSKSKGIVHCNTFELQKKVTESFDPNRILSHDSTNRSEIIQQHYNSIEPTILVSPSMITGLDLFGDFSRHQTILKMPYPSLASKKVKKRMETNKNWYGLATVRALMQAYGRSIRSIEDHAATYILDSCFGDLLKWNNKYFPKWFKDAIQYVD